jgi:hypothetical protein
MCVSIYIYIYAGTFSRENASMNLQLAGSSGLTDMREKKRIADKKCREKKKVYILLYILLCIISVNIYSPYI